MNFYRPRTRTFTCDAPTDKPSGDPTGTMDIRRKYSEQFATRFRKVRNLLKNAVVAQDVLSLKPGTVSPLAMAATPGNKELHFKAWLRNLLDKVVGENDGDWLRPMLQLSYNRALVRAMRLTKSNLPPHDTTDTINAMLALCKVEMHGIFDAVVQQATRAASLAWLHNESPAQAFVEMSTALLKIGAARTRAMVELMVVKMFTTATLDQFVVAGVQHVGLIPETKPNVKKDRASVRDAYEKSFGFSGPGSRTTRIDLPSPSTIGRITKQEQQTEADLEEADLEAGVEGGGMVAVQTAGDNDVCPECDDIESSNPYTIDEARSLIPAHPYCRCAFVPDDGGGGFFSYLGKLLGGDRAQVHDYNENHDPKTGEFSEGGAGGAAATAPLPSTPKERASSFRQVSKGTNSKLNEAIVADIPGLKLEHTADVSTRDLHEAIAHIAADSNEMKSLLANRTIVVKQLPGLHGVQKGKTIYISSNAFKEHGVGFASSVIRHELEHARLELQKVPSNQQESRVQHTAGTWSAIRYSSIANTNPAAAAGFKYAANQQGVKV